MPVGEGGVIIRERFINLGIVLAISFNWVVIGLAFWGGLIYFGFWCLKYFGVI